MAKKHPPKDYAPHIDKSKAPPCEVAGCKESGMYKAPKSRSKLHDYQWFCLEHIRQHNAKWDFFADMDRDQIEDFMKDAVTGHRPTWDRTAQVQKQYEKLQQALDDFLLQSHRKPRQPVQPALPPKVKSALAVLDIEYPVTQAELKAHYRKLVKKHHPDANRGDKHAENTFKKITAAYACVEEFLDKE